MFKNRKMMLFVRITLSVSYAIAGLLYLLGGEYQVVQGSILATFYMFIPMILAIIFEKIIYKNKIKDSSNISFDINRWFIVAWLLPLVIGFITLGVSLIFPDVTYSSDLSGLIAKMEEMVTPDQLDQIKTSMQSFPVHPIWITVMQSLIAGATINAIAGFGEDLGWRGLLLNELSVLQFWKASLAIGIVWGIWHAPLILMGHNYPNNPIAGIFMMLIRCILLSPIFVYIVIKSESVIAAAILHGTLNASAGIPLLVVKGGGIK